MTIGKNKKPGKSKKGGRKKTTDPFAKKEWYSVRAPVAFAGKNIGNTVVTKTAGQRTAREGLMGRVFDVSLGDLKSEAEQDAFRTFKFKVDDVQGFNCLTSFSGMDITQDKLRSMIRKWQSLIECYADVKTNDGFGLRVFAMACTKRASHEQKRRTSYAQHSQVKAIRKRMVEIITKEAQCDLVQFIEKLSTEIIGKAIETHCQAVYPLQNCLVRKVKMIRAPKVDLGKLAEGAGGLEALQDLTKAPVVQPVTVDVLAASKKERKDAEARETALRDAKNAPKTADTGSKVERPSTTNNQAEKPNK